MKSIIKLCFFLSSIVLFQACTNINDNNPNDLLYSVQSRENVATISNRYGCHDYQELALINGIQPPYFVYPGQTLRIPISLCQGLGGSGGVTGYDGYYTVVKGDTLYDIARNHNISVNDIANMNDLRPPYTLSIGQQLKIGSSAEGQRFVAAAVPSRRLLKPRYHKVVKGETLYRISKKYGYSVHTIANWNSISSPDVLSIGQELIVSPPDIYDNPDHLGSYNNPIRNTGMSGHNPIYNNPTHHIVRPGDTLQSIANMYHLTVEQLSAWNGMGGAYHIYPNLRLSLTPP